jgi:DNA polymerase III alpha subunit
MISKDGEDIVYGLRDIKGIGERTAQWVVDNAPYVDGDDLIEKMAKTEKCPCNMGHFWKMMAAGAFDFVGRRLEKCEVCDGRGKVRTDPNKRLLDPCENCNWSSGQSEVNIPDPEERAKLEEELLGIALTDPNAELIEQNKEELAKLDPFDSAESEQKGQVIVPGVIKNVKKTKVRPNAAHFAGRDMAHVTLQWEGDEVTFVAFPDAWDEYSFMLREGILGEFELKTTAKGPQLQRSLRLV